MTTCTSCGTEFETGLAACPDCGTAAPVDLGIAEPLTEAPPADVAVPDAVPVSGPTSDEKNLAMLAHASAASALIGLPVVGPLIVWITQKDKGGFVEENAREALNFNISYLLWTIIAGISVLFLIGFILLPIISIAWIVFTVLAAIKASEGETYQYPLTLRLIK